MINFRKLAAASSGKLLRAYFTENTPEPIHDPAITPGGVTWKSSTLAAG